MAINLTKEQATERLVSLKKTATNVIEQKGLNGQKARVALALDISGSMSNLFARGTVQNAIDRLLGLALNFDDNGAADIFLFGKNNYSVGELNQGNFYGFVEQQVSRKYQLEGGTHYAGVMQRIRDFYYPGTEKKGMFGGMFGKKASTSAAPNGDPVYVLFLTDGDNQDKPQTEQMIREVSGQGIFWQFVGVGNAEFPFLEKLDNLSGRVMDNANFFQINDLDRVNEDELYSRLLGEFPQWLSEAKSKGMV